MKIRALIFAFLLFTFALDVRADRLFTSGFEENNLTQTMWSSSSASPTFVTTQVHSGTYALEIDATQEFVRRTLASSVTSGTYFVRLYLRISTLPGTQAAECFATRNSSLTAAQRVTISTSGVLTLLNDVASTSATGSTLSTGQWYRMEVRILVSDTVGEVELLVDGVSVASLTAQDTLNGNLDNFVFGVLNTGSTARVFQYDDIAINDANGTFQASWPGAGKIAMVKPASDDTVTWTKTGANCSATTNADCVDDEPGTPDDTSGYNNTSTVQTDRLNTTGLPSEVPSDADIILVDVYARIGGSSTTGTNTARVTLWDEGGSKSAGPTGALCDVNGWTFMTRSEERRVGKECRL